VSNTRFVALLLYLFSTLLVWAAAFLAAYGWTAVVCSRRWEDTVVWGGRILPISIAAITVFALALTAALVISAVRRHMSAHDAAPQRLVARILLTLAFVSAIAVVWNGLPALIFDGCA